MCAHFSKLQMKTAPMRETYRRDSSVSAVCKSHSPLTTHTAHMLPLIYRRVRLQHIKKTSEAD